MEHEAPTEWKEDKSESYKTKTGLIMVPIFTAVYFIFIILAVADPQLLSKPVGSLNVAITYGFGIIILAIVMALIYNHLCSRREKADEGAATSKRRAR